MSRMSSTTGGKAIRFAVTGALAVGLLTGCAGSSSKQLARAGDHAVRSSAKAGRAISAAEELVARSPNEAAARLALGQAYLQAGRFDSAATTFADAIELGDASGRTQLHLALAQIGAGDNRSAVEVLDAARDTIPAADRGLALALAGQTGRGIAILLDAVRGGEDSPKLRQNLAYAFALDGRWREARVAMAQDVPADRINDRIGEWAMMSRPEDVQKRVASLLSVPTGVEDPGQPQALALGGASQEERLAAAPAPAPDGELPAVADQPVAAVSVAPEPAPVAVAAEPAPAPASTAFATAFTAAPQRDYVSQPVVQAIPAPHFAAVPLRPASARRGAIATRPASADPAVFMQRSARAAAPAPAPRAVAGGTHLVQLGSFSSEANARRAVGIYSARDPELRNYRLTIIPVVVQGKNYWRVAASGLNGNSAQRLCSGVKNRGGACFAYAANRAPGTVLPAMAFAGGGAPKARR